MAGDGHEEVVGMCEPSGEKKWAEWEQERALLGNEALVCARDVSQVENEAILKAWHRENLQETVSMHC